MLSHDSYHSDERLVSCGCCHLASSWSASRTYWTKPHLVRRLVQDADGFLAFFFVVPPMCTVGLEWRAWLGLLTEGSVFFCGVVVCFGA